MKRQTKLDRGLLWLELDAVQRAFLKSERSLARKAIEELLEMVGFFSTNYWFCRMVRAMRPMKRFFEKSPFSSFFETSTSSYEFREAFQKDNPRFAGCVIPVIRELIASKLARLSKTGTPPRSPFIKRLDELKRAFRLNEAECEILAYSFLYLHSGRFEKFCDKVSESHQHSPRRRNFQGVGLCITSLSPLDWQRALSREGTLRRLGLLDDDGVLSPEVQEFLLNIRKEPLSQKYFHVWKGAVLPLERLMISETDIRAIRNILENRQPGQGVNILLGGIPGTGKTETARALARELGLTLHEIRCLTDDRDTEKFRLRALWACRSMMQEGAGAILVDESDDLLGTGSRGFFSLFTHRDTTAKALINEALDHTDCVQIWIANHLEGMDPSTRRRFAYAVRYDHAGPRDRQAIWKTAAERYQLSEILGETTLRRLANVYTADAGGIDSALRNAANLPQKGWKGEAITGHIEQLLISQKRFNGEDGQAPLAHLDMAKAVPPSALSVEPAENIAMVFEILDERAREHGVLKDGGKGEPLDGQPGRRSAMTLLLEGPPGTGKTHFVKHLAERLDRPLHHKTASSILSKWVGEAEQNIRNAFRQAQREGAILFFDEIDGLLRDREGAQRSWEVTQVNELLSALESFDGVFVAATNHASGLDTASLRRFHFRLRFEALKREGVKVFYQTMLSPLAEGRMNAASSRRLAALEGLVPSDFATLRDRLAMRRNTRPTHDALISSLAEIRDSRRVRPKAGIGFAT